MLSPEDRYQLLETASELSERRAYADLVQTLKGLDLADLLKEPELGFLLAKSQYELGMFEAASSLAAELREPCLARGRDRLYCHRLLIEANIQVEFGELWRAIKGYSEILSISAGAGDQRFIAAATMNLATIAWLKCEYATALTSYERAMAAYQSLAEDYQLAGCHHNIAMVYKELGLLFEAELHFDKSLEMYSQVGGSREYAFNSYERAMLMNIKGEKALAEITARRALAVIREFGNPKEEGEALRTLGVIHNGMGNHKQALEYLNESLSLATTTRASLLRAEVIEELSILHLHLGDALVGDLLLGEAQRMYTDMGAETRAAKAGARARSTQLKLN